MKCKNGPQAAVIRDTRRQRKRDVRRTAPQGMVDFERIAVSRKRYQDAKLGFFRSRLGVKTEFDEFLGFLRSRCPLPLSDGIHRGLRQHRVAANHVRHLHFSAGRNYNFHPDDAPDLQLAGQFWIHRDHFVHNLPLGFRLFLNGRILSKNQWGKYGRSQK